jgi:hypothetical protein
VLVDRNGADDPEAAALRARAEKLAARIGLVLDGLVGSPAR